jgi:hypothetical protein
LTVVRPHSHKHRYLAGVPVKHDVVDEWANDKSASIIDSQARSLP